MEKMTEWSRTLEISFDLAPVLARKRVKFAGETVVNMDHETKTVTADKAEHRYDFLVVATGHMSANQAVQGLGPFDGPGHSPMWAPKAEEIRSVITRLLSDPGPVVVGAAPGASCIRPFGLRARLRARPPVALSARPLGASPRHRAPDTSRARGAAGCAQTAWITCAHHVSRSVTTRCKGLVCAKDISTSAPMMISMP